MSRIKAVESIIPYPVALAWAVIATILLCSLSIVTFQFPHGCGEKSNVLGLAADDGPPEGAGLSQSGGLALKLADEANIADITAGAGSAPPPAGASDSPTGGGPAGETASCSDWLSASRPVQGGALPDPWESTKWTQRVSPCLVAGLPIEELEAHLNFRRGWTLGFVDDVEDKTQVLPMMRGAMDLKMHTRERRVYIDLGAKTFDTSVTWFLRMYPLDFTEIHAVEARPDVFQKPNTTVPKVLANDLGEDSRLRPKGQGPADFPQWLLERVHPYTFFVSSMDDQEKNMVNVTRWFLEDLQLKEGDSVVVKMDIEGHEWAILQHWLSNPRMAAIVDELFVELPLHIKRAICAHHVDNPRLRHVDLARWCYSQYGLRPDRSTVGRILKSAERWAVTATGDNQVRRRGGAWPELEQAMARWIANAGPAGVPLTLHTIRDHVATMARNMGIPPTFRYSIGWVRRALRLQGVRCRAAQGKAASADMAAVRHAREKLPQLLTHLGVTPRDTFNLDETALWLSVLPRRTYSNGRIPGRKVSKERLTVAFLVNADGSHVFRPLVIN
ncbi:unnamed protein product [Closterium sp. NIES-65]|nr:unnamed protein product [Closterium sp. NIES-65]